MVLRQASSLRRAGIDIRSVSITVDINVTGAHAILIFAATHTPPPHPATTDRENKEIDVITLPEELRRMKKLKEAGRIPEPVADAASDGHSAAANSADGDDPADPADRDRTAPPVPERRA